MTLIIVLVVLQFFDLLLTLAGLQNGLVEANPVVDWLMDRLGQTAGLVVAKLAAVVCCVYAASYSSWLGLALVLLYAVAVVWNLRLILRER